MCWVTKPIIHNNKARPLFEKAGFVASRKTCLRGYFLMYITSFTALTTRPTLGSAASRRVGA